MKNVTTLLAFSLLMAAPAFAGSSSTSGSSSMSGTSGSGMLDFRTLDTDRNGSLSSDEFNKSGTSDTTLFGRVDKNGDGSLSRSELDAWNKTGASMGSGSSGTGTSGSSSGTSGSTGGSGTGSGGSMGGSGSGMGGSGTSGSGGSSGGSGR